jgi:allantoinase
MRTLIRGGTIVLPDRAERLEVIVEGERVSQLLPAGVEPPEGDFSETIDATDLVVLPGAIDAHTHFIQDDPEIADPDPVEYEGFVLGSHAALAGGVTCVIEMPHARPPTIDGASFVRKRELAEADAIVDFALWGGVVEEQPPNAIPDQLGAGAAALKAYMCGSDPLFPGIDDQRMLEAMTDLAPTSVMLGVHAENDVLLRAGVARMTSTGRTDPLAHADSRPSIVEIEAVARSIVLASSVGAHVHIVHLSTAGAAELVREAKRRGERVTAETCPHYLLLDRSDLERLGGFARCAPPLRTRDDVEGLWEAIRDGTIDCTTSDHCAFTGESRDPPDNSIWSATTGLPGVQTMLPLVASEARKRGFEWPRIVELTSAAPARLWGLEADKGRIVVGCHADLTFIDPRANWTIRGTDLVGAHRWTPFEGVELQVRVVRTMRRGVVVFDSSADASVVLTPGTGMFIPAHGIEVCGRY